MKKRTQAKFENGVISAAKVSFARNSPKYGEVLARCRVTRPRMLKDGARGKVDEVWSRCEKCLELVKDIEVDHRQPVIEIGKTRRDYTLDQIIARLDCDISNLQALCISCHDEKTAMERELREGAK
jgi:hypothetical protein